MSNKDEFVEEFGHLNEPEVRARLLNVKDRLREAAEALRPRRLDPTRRAAIEWAQRDLIRQKDMLKNRLHQLAQIRPGGSVKTGSRATPVEEIPDEEFVMALYVQRGVVDAFKLNYHAEGERFGELLNEGIRRGLVDERGVPLKKPAAPGAIPTLEEVAKPLGYVSGFGVGVEPRHPYHDDRRVYDGTNRKLKEKR